MTFGWNALAMGGVHHGLNILCRHPIRAFRSFHSHAAKGLAETAHVALPMMYTISKSSVHYWRCPIKEQAGRQIEFGMDQLSTFDLRRLGRAKGGPTPDTAKSRISITKLT